MAHKETESEKTQEVEIKLTGSELPEKEIELLKVTLDNETAEMIRHAERLGIDTVFHRQSKYGGPSMCKDKSRCYFGTMGLCCRQCGMGPCRIRQEDLQKSYKINKGTCGASADTIVARNLIMMVARGTSAHASHARHIALTLLKTSQNKTPYTIKEPGKLKAIAARLNINEAQSVQEVANKVSSIALSDVLGSGESMSFSTSYCKTSRIHNELKVIPRSVGLELLEEHHETAMGTMADPEMFFLHAARLGLADIASLVISSELADVLFGIPTPVCSKIGFNVLDKNKVNIVIHGHVQLLSEKIVEFSENRELIDKARSLGATGINVVGCCCTGNEILIRHGVPLAGSNLQQELIIATGLVEGFVVDVQCIYPNIENIARRFHTKLISTMEEARFASATHIPFNEENADEIAKNILNIAIENFPNRGKNVFVPQEEPRDMVAGFSVEAIERILSNINADDPLKPLIDNIASGNVYGIVLLAGCTSPKVIADASHVTIAKELLARNVLIAATGCAAQACARAGLLTGDATEKYAGDKLKEVLRTLGKAAGYDKPLPPVWHFGGCSDNARVIILAYALARKLGVEIKDLPIAVSAAEWVAEKATAIGTGSVALGITVHLGITPPILGSQAVVSFLTQRAEQLFGGKFFVELDPTQAAKILLEHIKQAREKLGIGTLDILEKPFNSRPELKL